MKVVYAATPDQMSKINELIEYFYTNIFPNYFTDSEIVEFEQSRILDPHSNDFEAYNTLKESFKVISSLNTLIAILESHKADSKHEILFNKNVSVLNNCGLHFPFEFSQFTQRNQIVPEHISVYKRAINKLMI